MRSRNIHLTCRILLKLETLPVAHHAATYLVFVLSEKSAEFSEIQTYDIDWASHFLYSSSQMGKIRY